MSSTIISNVEVSKQRRGMMLVLSSPSGAGKTTLTRTLLSKERGLDLSISVTTRKRRASEIDGVHYHFISDDDFDRMKEKGELLEWATVHENSYGTMRAPVESALAMGKDVLFDIDIQGAMQLYDQMREDIVSIFILPPSIEEMKTRLHRRAEDSEQVILRRLETAIEEIQYWKQYDYLVVNDDLGRAFADLRAIFRTERLRRSRLTALSGSINGLVKDLRSELNIQHDIEA